MLQNRLSGTTTMDVETATVNEAAVLCSARDVCLFARGPSAEAQERVLERLAML